MMGAPDIVMDIADRHVQRVIIILPCSDRYSGFIAATEDWQEKCATVLRIFRNQVLHRVFDY